MAALWLPTYVKVTEIKSKVNYSKCIGKNVSRCWAPARKCTDFQTLNAWPWYLYTADGFKDASTDQKLIKRTSAFTVFWCSESRQYHQVPYNVLRENVDDRVNAPEGGVEADDWGPLMFFSTQQEQTQPSNTETWYVGNWHTEFRVPSGNYQAWAREYLPPAYFSPNNTSRLDGLCGKMPLLLALAAFCQLPGQSIRALLDNFRRNKSTTTLWTNSGHPFASTKIHKRGLIVEIGLGPKSCSPEQLDNWERGRYGSILTIDNIPQGSQFTNTRTLSVRQGGRDEVEEDADAYGPPPTRNYRR